MATATKKTTRTTAAKTTAAKTTAAKTTAKSTPKETAVETVVEPVVEEVKKEPRKYEPSDLIPCTNVFAGQTIMIGQKTGIMYTWEEFGSTEEVEYRDLSAEILKRTSSYIYEPLIIVEDDELIEQRRDLKEFYEKLYSPEELVDVLMHETPARMRAVIESLPGGAKDSIKNLAATMIQNGTLDSVKKIKIIDEIFGTKLMMQTELFG